MLATTKTRILTAGLLLLAGLGLATSASADEKFQIRLRPSLPTQTSAPRLGFSGHFDNGHGMHVDSVRRGSPAARLGLEPGDTIIAIDGQRIHSLGHYYGLLGRSGNRVRLHIEDWRTGRVVVRTAFIDRFHDHHHHNHGHNHGGGSLSVSFDF